MNPDTEYPQNQTETTRIRLSGNAGLKHRLVNNGAAPVLKRFALKQCCFNQ